MSHVRDRSLICGTFSGSGRTLHNVCDTFAEFRRACHDVAGTSMARSLHPTHVARRQLLTTEVPYALGDTEKNSLHDIGDTSSKPRHLCIRLVTPVLNPDTHYGTPMTSRPNPDTPFAKSMTPLVNLESLCATSVACLLNSDAHYATSAPRLLKLDAY